MNSNDLHFLKKLKDAKSSSIQTELNNYLNEGFKKIISLDKPVMGKMVQDFITKLLIDFAKLWKIDLKRNEKHYDEICDGLESIITKSLYNK